MIDVRRMAGAAALGVAMLGSGLSGPPAHAAYIVTLQQVGANVVATGTGSLDLAGLTAAGPFGGPASISPNLGSIVVGPTFQNFDGYSGFTGPVNFGTGGNANANTGSGAGAGVDGFFGYLFVPVGYVSGTSLGTSTATWDNATFSSLGVTPGTYTWNWGSGPTADSFTLDIPSTAVPEPSSLPLLALSVGFVMLLATRPRMTGRQ